MRRCAAGGGQSRAGRGLASGQGPGGDPGVPEQGAGFEVPGVPRRRQAQDGYADLVGVAGGCQRFLRLDLCAQSWVYSRFTMPWPVRPRDAVLRVTTRQGADGSVTRIFSGVADYLPEQKGWVRVSQAEGYWAFIPKAAGEGEGIYQMHSEPGGRGPAWLDRESG